MKSSTPSGGPAASPPQSGPRSATPGCSNDGANDTELITFTRTGQPVFGSKSVLLHLLPERGRKPRRKPEDFPGSPRPETPTRK